jgi:hypothetical protein
MAAVRGLLARVARLEQAKVSPFLRFFGTPEEFKAEIHAGLEAGTYEQADMNIVLASVLKWMRQA